MMKQEGLSNNNKLQLKALSSLSGMDFVIKDYQRGYRWTPTEVNRLLDDFAEFVKRKSQPGEFYCLQPVVVRKIKDFCYEVIDGQQRLTTLNLLLQYLSEGIRFLYPSFKLYGIEYTTRPESRDFLSNIKQPKVDAESYIDFYFMNEAFRTIVDWFAAKNDDSLRNDILTSLLKTKVEKDEKGQEIDDANNIRVIWYEVAEDEAASSVDIFTRLNIGKIPLTDAELVKALFLNDCNYSGTDAELRKINLATEWNQIEQDLHDDRFWYFLNRSNNPMKYSSRIEFIFDILSKRVPSSPKYHTFNEFYRLITSEGVEKVWLKVKQTYNLLKEWFNDRELYHIIGYLLEHGVKINDLKIEWALRDKDRFRNEYLRNKVSETVKGIEIPELSYDNHADVRKILLLFNILTVLKKDNSDMRFPFDRFKTENWDIEHVCSQTDRIPEKSAIIQWCKDILDLYLNTSEPESIEAAIDAGKYAPEDRCDLDRLCKLYLSEKPDKEEADNLFKKFQKRFFEDDNSISDKDNISNLALLDSATNRSYGNAFFPIKRKRIIENDSNGVFVPIATKNLFLKYYTPRVNKPECWTKDDSRYYCDAIVKTINDYINPETDE